jgi:hypothetical protein
VNNHSSCLCMSLSNNYPVHAQSRGADSWWKSFTTGKSAKRLGGVPHDTYGMTSLSIRQYVLGIYKHLGLREKDVTKVQTGGPGMFFTYRTGNWILNYFGIDGDLGSSVLLSSSFSFSMY